MKKNELYDVIINIDDQLIDRAEAIRRKSVAEQTRNSEAKTVNTVSLMRIAASIVAIVVATVAVMAVRQIIDHNANNPPATDYETLIQNTTVQVSNVSTISSTTPGDSAPLYFAFLTVPSERKSFWEISLFEKPSATSWMTSNSFSEISYLR